MKAFLAKFFAQVAPSVLAWGLSIAVPAVPPPIWLAIIKALLAGDLTLAHIQQFMKDHNIKTYSDPEDFPEASPTVSNIPNFLTRQPPE